MSERDTRSVTAFNIVQWYRWADSASSDIIKEMRAERVTRYIFPDEKLSDDEREKRERAVERARAMERDNYDGWPEPFPPPEGIDVKLPETVPPMQTPDELGQWDGLISRNSSAYKRASMRDGTQARVDAMRLRAQGSPFDAEEPRVERPARRSPEQEEALARRNREIARRARR